MARHGIEQELYSEFQTSWSKQRRRNCAFAVLCTCRLEASLPRGDRHLQHCPRRSKGTPRWRTWHMTRTVLFRDWLDLFSSRQKCQKLQARVKQGQYPRHCSSPLKFSDQGTPTPGSEQDNGKARRRAGGGPGGGCGRSRSTPTRPRTRRQYADIGGHWGKGKQHKILDVGDTTSTPPRERPYAE